MNEINVFMQLSIRDNYLNCPHKCDDHLSSSPFRSHHFKGYSIFKINTKLPAIRKLSLDALAEDI